MSIGAPKNINKSYCGLENSARNDAAIHTAIRFKFGFDLIRGKQNFLPALIVKKIPSTIRRDFLFEQFRRKNFHSRQ